ncbi:ATP phosphoribosyltransferase [Bacillota bacterium LX-D]|nr:ATP phosphoribosyltransferase [Bacillota bacterium LX-D]
MIMDYITIALPKGKLGVTSIELLAKIGLPTEGLETDSRCLLFDYPAARVRYIICRPTDIPTYVEYGAADLGIVGKDTIVEAKVDIFELVDLKFGKCKFVVAMPEKIIASYQENGKFQINKLNHSRVATKFPNVAASFFAKQGMQMEIIKLHGNIELAPRVGLAEMIVDIVSTGTTLRENGLKSVAEIFEATSRLIANRVSYRIKNQRLMEIAAKFREACSQKQ